MVIIQEGSPYIHFQHPCELVRTQSVKPVKNHIGKEEIENVNSVEEHRSKLVRNRVFDGNRKNCFYPF